MREFDFEDLRRHAMKQKYRIRNVRIRPRHPVAEELLRRCMKDTLEYTRQRLGPIHRVGPLKV